MKKRTKLMLGLSAMLLATAGVAATGTFAWFTATSQPSVSSALYTGSQIGNTTTTMVLGNVTITFTVSPITGVQLTNLNDGTLYKGMVSGTAINNETGVVTNGQVVTTALTDGEASGDNFIKAYEVTAAFSEATDAQKQALVGYEVSATLTALGQAKLRADKAKTGADDASHTLTVKFVSTTNITVEGEKYVRIQAKQTGADKVDLASDHTDDKLQIAALSAVTPTQTA